jgi:diketogulonate reductase-like aldo/keto reductase
MKYINHHGSRVPALGLGTFPMRGEQCYQAVRWALDIGYRHIDTAESYGNEDAVGRAIADCGIPRDEIFLTTKCGFALATADNVAAELSASLDKLRTEYVDLLLYHWHRKETPLDETLGALADAQASGQARHIGVGNFTVPLMREAVEVHNAQLFTNQFENHPLLRQPKVEAEAHRLGMIVTAHSPIARGRVVDNPVLANIGAKYGKSAPQVAIRWQLDKDRTMLVPKSTRREGLAANFDVFDFALDDEDRAAIETLPNGMRGSRPPFEPDWDPIEKED